MKKIALIPGTFDPVTVGHLELVRTAAALFDEVVVCISVNPDKKHLFDEETRKEMLRKAVAEYPNVRVDAQHGMTADYAVSIGASYIIRGIRNEKDAKYELEMADFNLDYKGVRTLLIPARADLANISSTAVREKLSKGESVADLVPSEVKLDF
jgi:pantetheine-phosphate adenylyltransferase